MHCIVTPFVRKANSRIRHFVDYMWIGERDSNQSQLEKLKNDMISRRDDKSVFQTHIAPRALNMTSIRSAQLTLA